MKKSFISFIFVFSYNCGLASSLEQGNANLLLIDVHESVTESSFILKLQQPNIKKYYSASGVVYRNHQNNHNIILPGQGKKLGLKSKYKKKTVKVKPNIDSLGTLQSDLVEKTQIIVEPVDDVEFKVDQHQLGIEILY